VGEKIRSNKFFTINLLSVGQNEIAHKYSTDRSPENILDSNWIVDGNFTKMLNSRISLNCKLLKIYDKHAADIFVGQVIKYFGDHSNLSLVYDARRYGSFQSN
jgi:flavin reductase (DIM6/NTAB) family NADH-FMN oxidoreductase RutF